MAAFTPLNLQEAVLETMDALLVVLDRQGQIVQFNRACEKTTGYSFSEVEGQAVWDVLLVPEERESVKAIFAGLQNKQGASRHENYWVSKAGQRRLIAWSNTTILDSQGSVEYVVG
ncbi:MAG: PAS domain-containing protein, partial [Cyanobacteria bacterium P01_A01_bin.17]